MIDIDVAPSWVNGEVDAAGDVRGRVAADEEEVLVVVEDARVRGVRMLIIGSGVRSNSGAYERRTEAVGDHRHLVVLGHLAERRHPGGGRVRLVVGEQ